MDFKKNINNKIGLFGAFIIITAVFISLLIISNTANGDNSNTSITATSSVDLKGQIDQKNQELLQINQQIKATQDQLDSTTNQKQSLQNDLNQVNSQLNQLNLGIKASQVTVEKLGLEINATQYDIQDSQNQIVQKREAIANAMRQLQQSDNSDNFLIIFLKNKSLADSMFEMQGLVDLQTKLNQDISDLKNLNNQLNDHLSTSADIKKQKELEAENLSNKKIIIEQTKQYRQTLLIQTKSKEKAYQQSLADLQKKQDQIANEIESLDAAARQNINPGSLPTPHSGVLGMPVNGPITQGYGATSFAQKGGYRGKWHNGVDIGVPVGTPIVAAEKGVVLAVGNQDAYCPRGAYGKFIAIRHDNNLVTLYGHLSLQVAKEGQEVNRGDLIGYTGMTGYTTGPHLHFGVYDGQTFKIAPSKFCGPKMPFGGDLNPKNYL